MTRSCAHCHKPNATTARKCVHCGNEARRALERAERSVLRCPRCDEDAHVVQLASIAVDVCGGCAGMWLDREEVAALPEALSDAEMREAAKQTLAALRAHTSTSQSGRYLPCPVCARMMSSQNYLQVSGIRLERCSEHGTWLDHQHAVRLLELLDGSRLDELREAARDHEQAELERRLRVLESRQRVPRPAGEVVRCKQSWHVLLHLLDIF